MAVGAMVGLPLGTGVGVLVGLAVVGAADGVPGVTVGPGVG